MSASEIACPRAKTWMTPCIARDGSTALAENPETCVGCGADPRVLLNDLGERHPPASRFRQTDDARTAADRLAEQVAEYVGAGSAGGENAPS